MEHAFGNGAFFGMVNEADRFINHDERSHDVSVDVALEEEAMTIELVDRKALSPSPEGHRLRRAPGNDQLQLLS